MDEKEKGSKRGKDKDENKPDKRDNARKDVSGRERLDSMRERLYARGRVPTQTRRSTLSSSQPTNEAIPHTWDDATSPNQRKTIPEANSAKTHATQPHISNIPGYSGGSDGEEARNIPNMKKKTTKRSYRVTLTLAALIFFVIAMVVSSAFLLWGGSTISAKNISINISSDQSAVEGGGTLPFQVSIANQNAVPIESATLIIDYPSGTQSASGTNSGQPLTSERKQLNVIKSGQAVNVPLKATIFGQENEDKAINASLEYRVKGSNATFFKQAPPLHVKINSTPVVVKVDTVKSISSGQELSLKVTIHSNSPTPLSGILVKATYPSGFDFTESDFDTTAGNDTWLIDTLEPEKEKTFTVKGLVTGNQNEDKVFHFAVGVPNERDQFSLASTFSQIDQTVSIEAPFLKIDAAINNDNSDTVVVDKAEPTAVELSLANTQDYTLYKGIVTAKLSGNAIDGLRVSVPEGNYDSVTNTITWDSVDVRSLSEIAPGQASVVNFTLIPNQNTVKTPEIKLDVTAKAQRIHDNNVPQELVGTLTRTIKVESLVHLTSSALYSTGSFSNTGPIPPVAEKITQYTFDLSVQNGSNDVTGAQVTAVLPPYVTWLDLKTPGDNVTYDSVTRTITWDIGDMDANGRDEAEMQMSFTPSLSQVGTTPTLLETQRFKATDRFTGTVIRAQAQALTTALFNDPDVSTQDGRVKKQ